MRLNIRSGSQSALHLRSELCAGQSCSSTPNWEKLFFFFYRAGFVLQEASGYKECIFIDIDIYNNIVFYYLENSYVGYKVVSYSIVALKQEKTQTATKC